MKEDLSEFEVKEPYEPPVMKATLDELQAAKIPREYRDFCAHLLIPLNQCRCDLCVLACIRFRAFMFTVQLTTVQRAVPCSWGSCSPSAGVAGERVFSCLGIVVRRSTNMSYASMLSTSGGC